MSTSEAAPGLIRKLDELLHRHDELQAQMNDPEVHANPQKMIAISKEAGQLGPVVERYRAFQQAQQNVRDLREMAEGKADADMAELARAELPEAETKSATMLQNLTDEFLAAVDQPVESFFLSFAPGPAVKRRRRSPEVFSRCTAATARQSDGSLT